MRLPFLTATAAALLSGAAMTSPASAATVVATGFFTSDHCNCTGTGQPGGFATITATDNGTGSIDISITMNNGNLLASGGQDVVLGFNLIGDPTITYSNLNTTLFTVPNGTGPNSLDQSAGALSADGFGTFEYGVDLTTSGASTPVNGLSFTISGAGLDVTDFAEFSTNPPGDTPAIMALDIFSPNAGGKTGFVDLSIAPTPGQQCTNCVVPGPIAGAGLPALAGMGLFGFSFWRRRRNVQLLPT